LEEAEHWQARGKHQETCSEDQCSNHKPKI
jgi:hypothetical protein